MKREEAAPAPSILAQLPENPLPAPQAQLHFQLQYRDLLHLLDSLPYGLFITNAEGRIIYFNAAAERITGVPVAEAMGKQCFEVFQSEICAHSCTVSGLRTNGECIRSRELDIQRPDGRKLPIFCTTSLLIGQDQSINHITYVFQDIAERRRLETDLKLYENRYRRIFEGSKDMIFVTSTDGVIKDANQACVDLLDFSSKAELMSVDSVEAIFHNPAHWRVFRKQIDRHGSIRDFEACFRKKDNTIIHCLMSGNAVRDDSGNIIGYEAIAKDVTARMHGLQILWRQHRKLSLLNSIAVFMNVNQDLNDILAMALSKLLNVLGLKSGGIFLIDHAKRNFVLRVQEGLLQKLGSDTCHVLLYDVDLMRSLVKGTFLKPQRTFPPFKATLVGADHWHSVELVCYLITRKEKATGFIGLEVPPDKKIEDEDHHILGSLGNFLGSAVENSLLLQTVQQHREELQRLTARLFHSQEEERKRIARELHDEAGQALTGINFSLETILKSLPPERQDLTEQIMEVKKQINRTYQEMRRMSHRLHPAVLSDLGLEPALESYLADVASYSGLEIDFRMIGFEKRLDPETETALYRIAKEVVTNTLKHSGADFFKLLLIKSYPNIIFVAEDDGVGFDLSELDNRRDALGLLGIRERVALMGGTFSIRSSRNEGTKIRIEIPVRELPDE